MSARFRVGVTDGAGTYKQFALANVERLDVLGVYIGSDLTADVVLACAEPWAAHVRRTADGFEVTTIAGTVERVSPTVLVIEDNRIELGVAKRAGLPDILMPTRATEPHDVRPPPPLPPDPPPPPPPPPPRPPIELGKRIDEDTAFAALLACIAAKRKRPAPYRPLAEVLTERFDEPSVRTLFELWCDHDVGRIEVGELVLSDAALFTRLPVMVKGELYGEVDVDHDKDRTDLVVLGRHAHRHVAYSRGFGISRYPTEIDVGAGTESMCGTLGDIVASAVRHAHARGIPTDLDAYFDQS